jgi:hypothetical protein
MPPAAPLPAERERILILDFGSQFTQLIARRIREQNVYCEIHPAGIGLDAVRAFDPLGIVLSGGPASVLDQARPTRPITLDLGAQCSDLPACSSRAASAASSRGRRPRGRRAR